MNDFLKKMFIDQAKPAMKRHSNTGGSSSGGGGIIEVDDYQTEYRIPTIGTGTSGTMSLDSMFGNTGGTFADTPDINTTYYTSNTVV